MRRLRTRHLRMTAQMLFFGAFVALLILTTKPLRLAIPNDIFLRFSPLVGLQTMLAQRQVIDTLLAPGLLTIIVTLALGRVFCGWFCPMGATIDLFERLVLRGRRFRAPDQARLDRIRSLKYVLLVGMIGGALLSFQPALFLDPISLVQRSFIASLHAPVYNTAQGARNAAFRPLRKLDIHIQAGKEPLVYKGGPLILVMFGTVLGLSALQKRFWCRHLCPLGALLAIVSKAPVLRRSASEACTGCMRCERDCKMGCIQNRGEGYRSRECILCYNCQAVCPTEAVSFPFQLGVSKGMDRSTQLSRRRLIGGLGAGVVYASAVRSSVAFSRTSGRTDLPDQAEENTKSSRRIRPPGALPERRFLQVCARCGECMKVCPTNGLQPALTEAGFEGLFTPILVPRIGQCDEMCNACGQVCPTGAIQNFEIADKKEKLILGKAVIDRSTCRPWYGDKECEICDEHCSYDAIDTRVIDGRKRPVMVEDKCTGCGICEKWCPVTPDAAIYVVARDEKRPVIDEGLGPLAGFTSR